MSASEEKGSAALAEHEATFEGKELRFHMFRGRLCVVATDLGRVLGYAEKGRSIVAVIRKQWAGEMVLGQDYDVLRGADLREFLLIVQDGEADSPSRRARLMILYESGVDLVCLRTDKPLGRKLRRFLVAEVLPKLRRGEPVLPSGAARPERALTEPPKSATRLRALPATRSAVLRRLETVQQVLDYAEADLSVFCRMDRRNVASVEPIRSAIHTGLYWALSALIATGYARDEPGVAQKIEELAERQRRLIAALSRP